MKDMSLSSTAILQVAVPISVEFLTTHRLRLICRRESLLQNSADVYRRIYHNKGASICTSFLRSQSLLTFVKLRHFHEWWRFLCCSAGSRTFLLTLLRILCLTEFALSLCCTIYGHFLHARHSRKTLTSRDRFLFLLCKDQSGCRSLSGNTGYDSGPRALCIR